MTPRKSGPKLLGLKMAAGTVLLTIVLSVAGSPPEAAAQTRQEFEAVIQSMRLQVQAMLVQIAALEAQLGLPTGGPETIPADFRFTRDLARGSTGDDVLFLQRILNTNPITGLTTSGPGAIGQETRFFGPLTFDAVIRFQELNRAEILTPIGLAQGTGFVGIMTRAKLNALIIAGLPPPGGFEPVVPPPVTSAPAVAVSSPSQPQSTLAPERAARVPFTRVTLSAGTGSAVTVESITVERSGLAQNAVFDGIVLVDANDNTIGSERTLGSDNRATIGGRITIPAGQSRAFTVAGNMASDLDAFNGQVAGLDIVSVNVSSGTTVTGTLPVKGASHTVNSTLAIGSATVRVGSLGTVSSTREIGTDKYAFSSFRITAGSEEDLRLSGIRWQQSGSAAASDLENVVTEINGQSFTTALSADGRFYNAAFGAGIIIAKGATKEVTLRADVVSGSGRTAVFDIEDATDIRLAGEQFRFGITPSAPVTAAPADGSAQFTAVTPFFDGAVATISGGAVSVSRATGVSAQNIGVGVPGQVLGGFTFNVDGEAISVRRMVFDIVVARSFGSTASVEDITDATLENESGVLLAGPVNAVGSGTSGTVTFTTSARISRGETDLLLKGRLGSDFLDGDTVTISLEPASDLTDIRGDVSGNILTASPPGTISSQTQTLRSIVVKAFVGTTPAAQSVVAGAQDHIFTNFIFDTNASGEDVRLSSLPIQFTFSANPERISGCELLKGTQVLTTGGNVANPSSSITSGSTFTITLDSALTLSKGSVTTLALRCDVSSSASTGATYRFGLSAVPSVTGVSSGRIASADVTADAGPTMTVIEKGTLTVFLSAASPPYSVATGGSIQTAAVLRLAATGEEINLREIGLELSGTDSESKTSDISQILLFDGTRQVGSGFFVGTARTRTLILTDDFLVPKDGEKDLTIKAAFAAIGTNQVGTQGALVRINYNGDAASATKGTGRASGASIASATTADTGSSGVRIFRTKSSLAREDLSSTILANGEQVLLRFRVTADPAGTLGIHKLTLRFDATSVTVSSVNIFAFTDSGFSIPVSGVSSGGRIDDTDKSPDAGGFVEIFAENSAGASNPLQIPAGATRWFEVRATISGSTGGSVLRTTLEGDAAFPALAALMGTASQVDADANDDFVWSPNKTGTSGAGDSDWTNGFGIAGLPSTGLSQTLAR